MENPTGIKKAYGRRVQGLIGIISRFCRRLAEECHLRVAGYPITARRPISKFSEGTPNGNPMTAQTLPLDDELIDIAKQIDAACEMGNRDALIALDGRCANALRDSVGRRAARLWYYRSNAQAGLLQLTTPRSWKWRQPHRERSILYLRRARGEAEFGDLHVIERTQITINLANSLNHLGRGIEAIRLYDEALTGMPLFAMALGNRGLARRDLATQVSNPHHVIDCLTAALADLDLALSEQALWDGPYPDARQVYSDAVVHIKKLLNGRDATPPHQLDDRFSLGRSKKERRYRRWALDRQLFLNPINVLGAYTFAATDDLCLPDHCAPLDEPPHYIAWFNQLKQEFAGARALLFEAEEGGAPHYADRGLLLVDTLDYSAFGFSVEKMRVAFRIAYGLLDKVAGFINAYFNLALDPGRVDFRNVWLNKDKKSIRDEFVESENWPLRGLYWLAFDILDNTKNDDDAIAPEARDLNTLRNVLEHRCLILKDFNGGDVANSIVEYRSIEEFRKSTFQMLGLARAALFYLAFSVGNEEKTRQKSAQGLYVSRELPTYRGRWPMP